MRLLLETEAKSTFFARSHREWKGRDQIVKSKPLKRLPFRSATREMAAPVINQTSLLKYIQLHDASTTCYLKSRSHWNQIGS